MESIQSFILKYNKLIFKTWVAYALHPLLWPSDSSKLHESDPFNVAYTSVVGC